MPMSSGAVPHVGDKAVQMWLIIIALMVLAMVVVGGATRLTDSGLSITEWLPLLGAIPPLNAADWQIAFDKYKQIPEYTEINAGMSMAEFQFIYWWEWAHRFLGRMIGVAFAVPLAVFWLKGWIRPGLTPKLLGVLALGGLQGFFGWYMVQSGLSERVDVSHYRLALHLTTAFIILGLVVWLACGLSPAQDR
ncbi:MAG: COX15/CtaA family protein, partial [Pseudomonadota bacterium]